MLHQEEDEDELTEYEGWFIENEFDFPIELRHSGMNSMEIELFYHSVYKPVVAEVSVAVHKVMLMQYPSLSREIRPRLIEKINNVTPQLAHDWIIQLFTLMYYTENGFDLREKYECFQFWQGRYMSPDQYIKQYVHDYDRYKYLADEDLYLIESEFKQQNILDHRERIRDRGLVYDAFITPVLKHYDQILSIEGDAWVVLAGISEHFLTEYVERASDWDVFFKLGFPEEYLDLDPGKYYEIMMDTLQKKIYWCLRCGEKLSQENIDF